MSQSVGASGDLRGPTRVRTEATLCQHDTFTTATPVASAHVCPASCRDWAKRACDGCGVPRRPKAGWVNQKNTGPVVVFVHGLLSDPGTAWSRDPKTYWPHMVCGDDRIGNPAVFVASYYTRADSQTFSIEQAADSLEAQLRAQDVLRHSDIIFVAHSLGGIVVRELLSRFRETGDHFANKSVGVLLFSSPARGSSLASTLSAIAAITNNRLGKQLRPGDATLVRIDGAFWDVVRGKNRHAGRGLRIVGREIFESQNAHSTCCALEPRPRFCRGFQRCSNSAGAAWLCWMVLQRGCATHGDWRGRSLQDREASQHGGCQPRFPACLDEARWPLWPDREIHG